MLYIFRAMTNTHIRYISTYFAVYTIYKFRGFEFHRGHGCLFVVSVVCCRVEVSATSWSVVQRSPTDCGASYV